MQAVSRLGAVEANRKHLADLVRQAAKGGAKIVVLPETAITGYTSTDLKRTWHLPGWPISKGLTGLHPAKYAETVPGPSTRAFCKLAREAGVYLTIPLLEVDPKSGRYFNTLCLASPEGKLLLHYRKLNPWPFAEKSWTTKGDRGHQYVDTPYGRLALLICYDVNYEPPRLKAARIDILLYAIAWVDTPKSNWFDVRLPAVARANDMHIVGANWTVPGPVTWPGHGDSRIISRTGKILAKPARKIGETILYAELPLPAPLPATAPAAGPSPVPIPATRPERP